MIKIHKLEKHFKTGDTEVKAVDGVDLYIKPGEFAAIMGPSGSGKSTLLYLLGAMDKPTGGKIIIDGKNLDDLNDIECSEFRNKKLGFVFQSFHLLPRMNLIRNAEIPMIYAQVKPVIRKKRALAMLSAVGLEDRSKHFPPQLSGGQCQRAAIARALVNNPSLLLADEPTGNLDSKTGIEIIGIFQALNRQGMTIVMVTHDEGMAMYAQSVIRMRDGRIEKVEKVEKPLKSELPVELENSLKEALNEVF